MKKSKEKKANQYLAESNEWEMRKRGANSVVATDEEEAELDASLDLQMISLRLPLDVIEALKKQAKSQGSKYQPYIRQILTNYATGSAGSSLEYRVRLLEEKLSKLAG